MLRQWLRKKAKILYGAYHTRRGSGATPYEPGTWWDESFYTRGISDRQTIAPEKSLLSARYHYASVELLVLRHLLDIAFPVEGCAVFDVGPGAGHWLDFYLGLGAARCTGADISQRSVEFLRSRYAGNERVEIHHGPFAEILEQGGQRYDIVNAIGVLFHVVDDAEWLRGLRAIADSLREGGLLVVGGHFGWIDGANVQFDARGAANKRLRSRARWKRTLRSLGFGDVRVYRNRAYLHSRDTLPENNVLVARR